MKCVTKTKSVIESVNLELTNEEAVILRSILRKIGGLGKNRDITNTMETILCNNGIIKDDDLLGGKLIFES